MIVRLRALDGVVTPRLLDDAHSIAIVRGASATFVYTLLKDDGRTPEVLTGARIVLSVQDQPDESRPSLTKDSQGTSPTITVPNPRSGEVSVAFVPGDTSGRSPGDYRYDLWVLYGDGRRVPVVGPATLAILPRVTVLL